MDSLKKLEGHGVFANAKVDFAFKRGLGSEKYKDATIGLLNTIIPDKNITDVQFINTELPRENDGGKTVVVDIVCTDNNGNRFIVEMQKAEQPYFMQRMLYYSSRLTTSMDMHKGDSAYNVKPCYIISFLNFGIESTFSHPIVKDMLSLHFVTMVPELGADVKHPGSPEFFYFDLTKFTKTIEESENDLEIWLSLLNGAQELDEIPQPLKDNVHFSAFLEALKRANFTDEENIKYEKDMITELDMRYALEYSREKGEAKGKAEGVSEAKTEIAKSLKSQGVSINIIAKATGLTIEEVSELI